MVACGEMDEFSYYCTIGSLVLLQIAFYWLHKQDKRSRDVAWTPNRSRYDKYKVSVDETKVVLLLVADEQQHLELGELVRDKLEAAEFIVYELRYSSKLQKIEMLSPPPATGMASEKKGRRTIRLNPELDGHLDSALGSVENELSKGHLKLYGYVSLVSAGSGSEVGCSEQIGGPNYLLLHLASPIKLLVAFSSLAKDQTLKLVLVATPASYRREAIASWANDNSKSQDCRPLFRTSECNIGQQLSLIAVEDDELEQARPRWLSRAIGKIMRPAGSSPVDGGSCGLEAGAIVDLVVNKIRDNGR